jgi:hypothetical protein
VDMNFEQMNRDQLMVRDELLTLGINHFRSRLDELADKNRTFLEGEIEALEAEQREVAEILQRKFRENVEEARLALAGGVDGMAEYLSSR